MELNQEYYADYGSSSIGGLTIKYAESLATSVPKMVANGLKRLDPSNIWALNHGCHFIGSGGGAKSIAGLQIPTDLKASYLLCKPLDTTTLSGGNPVTTDGDFQSYSAIRWMFITSSYNPTIGYTTMSSKNIHDDISPITGICMKHLIAVPRIVEFDFTYGSTSLPSRAVTFSDAVEKFKAESHVKFTEGTFTSYRLDGIDFYYGEPGKRIKTKIFPLCESNYNGINYFSGLMDHSVESALHSSYLSQPYGYYTPPIFSDNIGNYGSIYPDSFVNKYGDPINCILMPVWMSAWFSRTKIEGYINDKEINTANSIAYEPDNASSGILLQYTPGNKNTTIGTFITPTGAVEILNSLGITWAEDETSAINYDPDAVSAGAYSVHIGVMEPGGITLGEGLAGDDIKKASNFGICEITDTPYDGRIPDNPGQNVDPDTGDIPLNTPGVTPFNTFNHMYCMTQSEVNDFANKIWNADETLWEQIVSGLSLYGEMPINAIISLRMYPIDLLKLFDVASTSIMRIGKTAITLDSQTEFVTKQKTAVVNMGSCVFPARYNNFLDYEPYTKAMLYLPYCGTVDVATADVVGKTVQVYYIIDVMTGGCTAVVYFGGIPYFYKNGRVGVEIPITANADSAVTSDALSLVTGGASSLLAAATGNPVAAALSLPSMVNSGLQLAKDSRSSFQTTGTQTPTAAQWTPQNAYFIVQRSVPDEPAGYGHSVGYVTLEGGTLGSFTGYTVMSNPDLTGVDCTEGEKEMIRNLLESGIYC